MTHNKIDVLSAAPPRAFAARRRRRGEFARLFYLHLRGAAARCACTTVGCHRVHWASIYASFRHLPRLARACATDVASVPPAGPPRTGALPRRCAARKPRKCPCAAHHMSVRHEPARSAILIKLSHAGAPCLRAWFVRGAARSPHAARTHALPRVARGSRPHAAAVYSSHVQPPHATSTRHCCMRYPCTSTARCRTPLYAGSWGCRASTCLASPAHGGSAACRCVRHGALSGSPPYSYDNCGPSAHPRAPAYPGDGRVGTRGVRERGEAVWGAEASATARACGRAAHITRGKPRHAARNCTCKVHYSRIRNFAR